MFLFQEPTYFFGLKARHGADANDRLGACARGPRGGRIGILEQQLLARQNVTACTPCIDPNDIILSIAIESKPLVFKYQALLVCATKLICLARRAKEFMYAPGGIGFFAAAESFDRESKRQRN